MGSMSLNPGEFLGVVARNFNIDLVAGSSRFIYDPHPCVWCYVSVLEAVPCRLLSSTRALRRESIVRKLPRHYVSPEFGG